MKSVRDTTITHLRDVSRLALRVPESVTLVALADNAEASSGRTRADSAARLDVMNGEMNKNVETLVLISTRRTSNLALVWR